MLRTTFYPQVFLNLLISPPPPPPPATYTLKTVTVDIQASSDETINTLLALPLDDLAIWTIRPYLSKVMHTR